MEHFDVLVVGAGISGIGAAYHLQTKCPGRTYAILEGRERLGGTWDLFRYPGIRSDSDMHTLGFSFHPWKSPKAIADGPAILDYVRETAATYGIDEKIRFGVRVEAAAWSSTSSRWTVTVCHAADGTRSEISCQFLFMCAGYYRYDAGHSPDFPGRDQFRGVVVHPQQWSDEIEHAGKRVVVIGSGATAVTVVPEIAKKASHVTMLQRSPTYIISRPSVDPIADWLGERLPLKTTHQIVRWKNVLGNLAGFYAARRFPSRARRFFRDKVKAELGDEFDVDTHFNPRYEVWDQRVCLVPDGDLFDAVRSGAVSMVTDEIEAFTENGLHLRSGRQLDADLIVTATGIQLQFLGGMEIIVDGERIEAKDLMVYKGMMFGGLPNLAMCLGYTNASWTLKVDLTCEYVCRLLNYMNEHGFASCMPSADPSVVHEPLIDFSSGYVTRAREWLPHQGSRWPWKLYQNYVIDLFALRYGRLADGVMRFRRANDAAARPRTVHRSARS